MARIKGVASKRVDPIPAREALKVVKKAKSDAKRGAERLSALDIDAVGSVLRPCPRMRAHACVEQLAVFCILP